MEKEKWLLDEFKRELLSEFIRMCRGNDYNKLTLLKIGDTIDRLYEKYSILPTVDVVEVVRCKDCKDCDCGYCSHDKLEHSGCQEDDFCSYGERRTDV